MNFNSICSYCNHRGEMDDGTPSCTAFPQGIPDDLLRKGFDHRMEYPGDNGVRFDRVEGVTDEQVESALIMP